MDDLINQSNLSLVPNDYLDMAPMFEILDATARLTFVDNYRLYYNGSVSDNLCGSSENHPKV